VEERVGVEAVYCVSRRKVSQFCLFKWMSPHAIMSVNCLFRWQSFFIFVMQFLSPSWTVFS
jgi:hypothetical protein